MKILHVLYAGLGGHGNVFFSMVSADATRQFGYEALFYGIEEVRPDFIEDCARNNIPWYFAKKNTKLDLKYYRQIYRFIRKSDPDIIFLHGSAYILPAKWAAMRSNKKCRIIIRETQANHLKTKEQWFSLSAAMLMADNIVCLTEEFRSQIQKKLGWRYRAEKVTVIPNGIDLAVYKPAVERKENKSIIIGMQSRVVRIKDHLTLLQAFALLKKDQSLSGYELKLQIAGDGEFKEELERYSETLGIAGEVVFKGMLDETALVAFLQQLDIYVHASLGETMSTAIMQAMACKLPIVASDVNGINNMISDRVTGLLVKPKNDAELASAIRECIVNVEFRKQLAENALIYSGERFSNQKMITLYKNIILG